MTLKEESMLEERVNNIYERRRKKVEKFTRSNMPNVEKILEIFEIADTKKGEYLWKIQIKPGPAKWGDWNHARFYFGNLLNTESVSYNLEDSSNDKIRSIVYSMNIPKEEMKAIAVYFQNNFPDKFNVTYHKNHHDNYDEFYLEVELKLSI